MGLRKCLSNDCERMLFPRSKSDYGFWCKRRILFSLGRNMNEILKVEK